MGSTRLWVRNSFVILRAKARSRSGCAALAGLAIALGAAIALVPPGAVAASADGSADWLDEVDWTLRRLIPRDGVLSLDNPPVLSWPAHPQRAPGASYRLRLRGPGDLTQAVISPVPRWMPTVPLPPGDYRWQVGTDTATGFALGRERAFRIDARASASCGLPTGSEVLASLQARQWRPRMLPRGAELDEARASWQDVRRREFRIFMRAVEDAAGRELAALAPETATIATALALAWRYAGDETHALQARRTLLLMAGWDAEGPTGELTDDQRNRAVYLSLARGYDLLHDTLTPPERGRVLGAALDRLRAYVTREIDSGGFDRLPYRSHAANAMSHAVEALVLLAGESPEADAMLERVWDHYRTLYPVWGAQDGSDGNSTGYGWLNLVQPAQAALVLRHAAGVDLACRAHLRRAGLQPVYFTPPVRPGSRGRLSGPWPPFGDGADPHGDYLFPALADREFRIYAALQPQPLYRWYSGQARRLIPATDREDYHPWSLGLLLIAPPESAAPDEPPAGTPDAIAFEESGAVAMHSALGDPGRTSVFFLSGRFGSWNHSKAEQNAFVVTMAGEPMLVASGYYEFSAHGRRYTRRTLAANAITFDGGQGQAEDDAGEPVESMQFRGEMVASRTEGDLFFATGDARLAYRQRQRGSGELRSPVTEALRTVAYLRSQGLIVVYDRLRSELPRRWEWNLHSLQRFEPLADGSAVRVRGGSQTLCVDMQGTASHFEQTDAFPIEPEEVAGRPKPRQWHGRYSTIASTRAAVFVAVLREHCGAGPTRVEVDEATGRVRIELPTASPENQRPSLEFDGAAVTWPGLQ